MQPRLALVFCYARPNRHSFNALAGALETDAFADDASVIFAAEEGSLLGAVAEALSAGSRTVVCVSFTTPQMPAMASLVRRLRRECASRVTLLAGGPHPTADPAGTLKLGVDIVVRGEGEATFLELLKRIGAGGDYAQVAGIAFQDAAGELHETERRGWIALDAYPPFAARYHKFGPVEITRGCPFACAFCQTSHLLGARPRHRSVEQLVKHVETMRRNGLRDVRLLSPDAFSYGSPDGKQLNLAALDALLAGLRRVLGQDGRLFVGSFPSEARPEHVTAETLGLVRRYANNDKIVIGAQSGSERTLELCHRGHNVDDVLSAVTLTLKAGLQANVDFILGLPGETDDDMDRTAAAIEKLAAMGARIHAHYFMPLPQTGFAGRRPSRLSRRLEKTVNRLVGRGHVYGEWQAQEKVARWLVGEG